jgi:hypothetical protein
MFRIISSKETSQIAMVTGPEPNKWDNLNNVRHEANRHFRNKTREYLKEFMSLQQHSKNKNIRDLYRGINEFKKGYQPRTW